MQSKWILTVLLILTAGFSYLLSKQFSSSSNSYGCDTGNPLDVMVPVGSWCVDKYEASIWSAPDGSGQSYFSNGHISDLNYPDALHLPEDFNRDGSGSSLVYALSRPGVLPARGVTWYQAAVACANSGKQLIPDSLWMTAALGTHDPDPGMEGTGGLEGGSATDGPSSRCNINSHGDDPDLDGDGKWSDPKSKVRLTARAGSTSQGKDSCISRFGVEDMIGNVWEWTDAGSVQAGIDTSGFTQGKSEGSGNPFNKEDRSFNVNGSAYVCDGPHKEKGQCQWKNNVPAAVMRGGYWGHGKSAGIFAVIMGDAGSNSGWRLGFRCARPRF